MSTSWDKYPELSTAIDVGGEIFDLKAETNVNSGYKGRITFYQTFHPRTYGSLPVEYLLRKYLPVYANVDKIALSDEDYTQLMDVLRRRARQLHDSDEYSSHVVNKIPIRRYETNILALMDRLRKGRKNAVKKVMGPKLSENDIFQLILEITWYMGDPARVPSELGESWKTILEHLREQRITDVLEAIHAAEKDQGLPSEDHPLQYFKKLDLKEVTAAKTLEEAKQRVRTMATFVEAQPIRPNMGKRLRNLMNVLHLKRYVDDDAPENEDGVPILNTAQLKRDLISNPMAELAEEKIPSNEIEEKKEKKSEPATAASAAVAAAIKGGGKKKKVKGGKTAVSPLGIPLGQAMLPVFQYLRMLFDPLYSMLEQITTASVKRAILPHLLVLLHLCNEFNTPKSKLEFGLYHLKNIPESLLSFLRDHLEETDQYASEMKSDLEREVFQKQLFQLPKVRLRSFLRNQDGQLPTMKDFESVYHLHFFIAGENLSFPEMAEFKKKNPRVDGKVLEILKEVVTPSSVFLCYTDSSTKMENIPLSFFQVDYNEIKIGQSGVTTEPFSPKIDALINDGQLPKESAFLDKVLTIKPYAIYNDAELALSVLMGLKERMPK